MRILFMGFLVFPRLTVIRAVVLHQFSAINSQKYRRKGHAGRAAFASDLAMV
jgi:hypothetical protein